MKNLELINQLESTNEFKNFKERTAILASPEEPYGFTEFFMLCVFLAVSILGFLSVIDCLHPDPLSRAARLGPFIKLFLFLMALMILRGILWFIAEIFQALEYRGKIYPKMIQEINDNEIEDVKVLTVVDKCVNGMARNNRPNLGGSNSLFNKEEPSKDPNEELYEFAGEDGEKFLMTGDNQVVSKDTSLENYELILSDHDSSNPGNIKVQVGRRDYENYKMNDNVFVIKTKNGYSGLLCKMESS